MTLSRRRFALGVTAAGTLTVLGLGSAGCKRRVKPDEYDALRAQLARALPDAGAVSAVAIAASKTLSEEQALAIVVDGMPHECLQDAARCHDFLRSAAMADYRAGRVVDARGWHLSRTEACIALLARAGAA